MNKNTRTIFLFSFILLCNVFIYANNGFTALTVDQGFLTAGKGNADHILLRINLKRDITMEPPILSGLRISMNGTTDCNDISALKVYATQSPFLNGDIKVYSLALARHEAPALWNTESFDITFSSEYIPFDELNYLWLTADISSKAKTGNEIDAMCEGLLCNGGTFISVESGNPEGVTRDCIGKRTV